MDYAAKFYITEQDLIERLGLDPEVTVITKVDFNAETGEIEVFFRSTKEQIGHSKFDGTCTRRHKL